jgi:hypothetical protein
VAFSPSLIFFCTVLLLSTPAALRAAEDAALPASVSFAYRHHHPMTALPESTIDSLAPDDVAIARKLVDPSFEPPSEIGTAPARELSRGGLCDAIASAARANDLPVSFLANLIWQESNFETGSISHAGAQGIAQFMPRTAAAFGLINPFEPVHAVFAAGEFLRKLFGRFGNLGLAAAAYNAGPKRVSDWLDKRGALPGETRNYVRKITGRPADDWASRALAHAPEASLMPARAPCHAAVEEIRTQAKVVRVAHLISDLAEAAAAAAESPRAEPEAKAKVERVKPQKRKAAHRAAKRSAHRGGKTAAHHRVEAAAHHRAGKRKAAAKAAASRVHPKAQQRHAAHRHPPARGRLASAQ